MEFCQVLSYFLLNLNQNLDTLFPSKISLYIVLLKKLITTKTYKMSNLVSPYDHFSHFNYTSCLAYVERKYDLQLNSRIVTAGIVFSGTMIAGHLINKYRFMHHINKISDFLKLQLITFVFSIFVTSRALFYLQDFANSNRINGIKFCNDTNSTLTNLALDSIKATAKQLASQFKPTN
jgi:hypothetical protein